MNEKFTKKVAFLSVLAALGLASCGGNSSSSSSSLASESKETSSSQVESSVVSSSEESTVVTSSETEESSESEGAKTSVTVTPVEHASALVTFGSFSMVTFSWTYSFDPAESVSDYSLTENDENLVIELTAETGYEITAVSVNGEEVTSYTKGDARAFYSVSADGDYVVTLTVEEKASYDSSVTFLMSDVADIYFIVIDGEGNEYDEIEYYDPDNWDEAGHISFPYSEPTYVDIFVTVFDPAYKIDKVYVDAGEATAMEHPMTGQTYYEYEFPNSGTYTISVTFNEIPA